AGPAAAPGDRAWAQGAAFPQGVAAGDVTHQAAVVWTRTDGPTNVQVEYGTDAGFAGARTATAPPSAADGDYTVRVELTGLQPGQRYHYRFVGGQGRSPAGTFVTAPALRADVPLTLIWGADTSEEFKPFRIFQGMKARNADLFLYLGDTIYSDFGAFRATTLEQYRQKYQINRADPNLREYLATIATWVIWDDHEVENNFDSEHIRVEMGLRAFREYWPIRPAPEGPGRLYRSFRWGRTAEVFILDTRQYRSPIFRLDGPEKTMLGRAQKQWLLDGLARSEAAVKVVVSTVALRHHSPDSWEGYAFERNEILRFIQERRIRNVLFLVADVHYAALLRHPEGPYEAISGPLAAILSRTSRVADKPETLWSAVGKFNYGWMRIAADGIVVEWRDDQDNLLHRARVPLQN
ncbi:MAG: alkaline phosphatase D family protein, partial [Armatimonadetes bacterium]|nr:alkaline phosphatase D family protein [Armatimonadota bacterium]